ncbi:hypothetical protein CERSUDRAFT_99188 [Gelatoporia subvermispora B]|uniref:ABM domain-containing protein n=1 Tax=Ceriporiopsis subvermispora (strain B) TaxID=914234 RepID=M2Q7J9_CERS8|nr:hypothetical protein CERSUDRAFT_99188 [Gelatoporia subvermispora B]
MSADPPCLEVAWAPSTDAYRENRAHSIQAALDVFKECNGFIKVYDAWKTLGHHEAVQKDPILYPKLGEAVMKFWSGSPHMLHVQPTSEPYASFSAPVTELAFVTLKPNQSKERLENLADKLIKGIPANEETGLVSALWGSVVEHDKMVALILGWNSVEAHERFVTTDLGTIRLLDQIREIADIAGSHSALHENTV